MASYPRAILLAGGHGRRLGTLGELAPKCLLPLFDKPLLLHQIEQCAVAGARDVLVCVAQRFAPALRAALALHQRPAATVTCVAEPHPLGPVGGLLPLVPWTEGQPTLVLLGDEYYEHTAPFRALAERPAAPDLLLGVVRDSPPHRILCSVLADPHGAIRRVREKPLPGELVGATRWCGLAAFGAGVLGTVTPVDAARCPRFGDLLDLLLQRGAHAEPLDVPEIHLNLNTAEHALLASLVAARRRAHDADLPAAAALDQAVACLLPALEPGAAGPPGLTRREAAG